MKARKVALLYGGFSAEREVSLRSGEAVEKALHDLGYEVLPIDVTRESVPNLLDTLLKSQVDVAFLVLHGPYGEDGTLQGMLEMAGIPYTGSGVLSSALCMDKTKAKEIFIQHQIPTPRWVVLREGDSFAPVFDLGKDVVVKPHNQGSTIGVGIVRKLEDLPGAVASAFSYSSEVLVEEFIPGRDITVGILGEEALEVVEMRPKSGFYDYTSKYTKGMTEYLCPAPLPGGLRDEIRTLSLKSHRVLRCAGATRVDLRLSDEGKPYVLEVNTIPGMTELSLLPMSAVPFGYDYAALVQRMIELVPTR